MAVCVSPVAIGNTLGGEELLALQYIWICFVVLLCSTDPPPSNSETTSPSKSRLWVTVVSGESLWLLLNFWYILVLQTKKCGIHWAPLSKQGEKLWPCPTLRCRVVAEFGLENTMRMTETRKTKDVNLEVSVCGKNQWFKEKWSLHKSQIVSTWLPVVRVAFFRCWNPNSQVLKNWTCCPYYGCFGTTMSVCDIAQNSAHKEGSTEENKTRSSLQFQTPLLS